MKNTINRKYVYALSFLGLTTLMWISCDGCKGVKARTDQPTSDATKTTNETYQQENSLINFIKPDRSNVDEYNVERQFVEFKNPKTGITIKKIDLVKENPFHKMGLKRRKEPNPSNKYFLINNGSKTKISVRQNLPKWIFDEIPNDFSFSRALVSIETRTTENKYASIKYQLDWAPDAYSDEYELMERGYSIHTIVIYDSMSNKIFTGTFDGYSYGYNVSEDGMYLFNMACITPEWKDNIQYQFTVTNIKTNEVVFSEHIENCKLHSGGGDYNNSEKIKSVSYAVEDLSNYVHLYLYYNNKFYISKPIDHIDNYFILPHDKIELRHINGTKSIMTLDSLFNEKNIKQ